MTSDFAQIQQRFAQHFPAVHDLSRLMYACNSVGYVCGIVVSETDDSMELSFKGKHGAEDIEYVVRLDAAPSWEPIAIRIKFARYPSYVVEMFPGDDEIRIKSPLPSVNIGKAVGCIGLAGGKSFVECWYKCRRDTKCWKDCLKEKGASFGVDITACLALTD